MSIRVPKGVTVDGRGFGGRFVSRDQLISLAAATDTRGLAAIERVVEREYKRTAAKHQRAAERYMEAPERWRERRQAAQLDQQEWERVRDAANEFRASTPTPKARPRRGPAPVGKPAPPAERESRGRKGKGARRGAPTGTRTTRGVSAREWEIGFKYSAKRSGSSVDVNIRVRRVDGRPISFAKAKAVLSFVRQNQETPDGFMVAGVDWRRPHTGTGWRHGDVSDLSSFWAPMFTRANAPRSWDIKPEDFRFGAVKDDEGEDDE